MRRLFCALGIHTPTPRFVGFGADGAYYVCPACSWLLRVVVVGECETRTERVREVAA